MRRTHAQPFLSHMARCALFLLDPPRACSRTRCRWGSSGCLAV